MNETNIIETKTWQVDFKTLEVAYLGAKIVQLVKISLILSSSISADIFVFVS